MDICSISILIKSSRYLEVEFKASIMSSRFSLAWDLVNSLSLQNRNILATRGVQLVPIGIPKICQYSLEPKLT